MKRTLLLAVEYTLRAIIRRLEAIQASNRREDQDQ